MRPTHLPLALAFCVLAACKDSSDAPPVATAAAAIAAPSEPEDCRACHGDVVARFEASAHRLAARALPATPPPAARFGSDAPVADSARAEMSLRPGATDLLVADPAGTMEARPLTHVLGGRRREDFLTPVGGTPHVLPVSWSVTRGEWIDPVAEELGGAIEAASPLAWTKPRRAHASACSRCHALPGDAEHAAGTCSACHGDASAHVARKSGRADAATWTRDEMRRATQDPWKGCAPCHSSSSDRPKAKDLGDAAPFADRFLPATFAGPAGLERQFRLDGTPGFAHGAEVQSLVTSRCFLAGGATCTTCHDPHGGPGASLKDADPDASCRSCHASLPAAHAKHPVREGAVPSSIAEPGGPSAGRLPGCVDCHAPALLPFGKGDLLRDHAISVPSPVADAAAGIVDACMGCHASMTAAALQKSMPAGGEPRLRVRRMEAFRAATAADGDPARAAALLTSVVADARQDAGTRASAAHLLGAYGEAASRAIPALHEAWTTSAEPVLVIAAAHAEARVGGDLAPLKERLGQEKDWRIALAIGGGLAARGDSRGAEAIEVIYGDEKLPAAARADAGNDLAVILIQQGACRRASSVLTDVVAKAPDSIAGWLNLGVARACLGEAPGAREAFVKVLELQPDHEMARRNLAMLEASAGTPPGK